MTSQSTTTPPVDKLVEDVLLKIFQLLVNDPDDNMLNRQYHLRYSSQVCKEWRAVIKTNQCSLWSRVFYISTAADPNSARKWTKFLLKKCKLSSTLYVEIHVDVVEACPEVEVYREKCINSILRRVCPEWNRMVGFKLYIKDSSARKSMNRLKNHKYILRILGTPAPNLRSFVFSFDDRVYGNIRRTYASLTLFNGHAPQLVHFNSNIQPTIPALLRLSPLRSLTYVAQDEHGFIAMRIQDVLEMLSFMPGLRSLSLTLEPLDLNLRPRQGVYPPTTSDIVPQAHLPHLEFLFLSGRNEKCTTIINHITPNPIASGKCHINLRAEVDVDTISIHDDLNEVLFPVLESNLNLLSPNADLGTIVFVGEHKSISISELYVTIDEHSLTFCTSPFSSCTPHSPCEIHMEIFLSLNDMYPRFTLKQYSMWHIDAVRDFILSPRTQFYESVNQLHLKAFAEGSLWFSGSDSGSGRTEERSGTPNEILSAFTCVTTLVTDCLCLERLIVSVDQAGRFEHGYIRSVDKLDEADDGGCEGGEEDEMQDEDDGVEDEEEYDHEDEDSYTHSPKSTIPFPGLQILEIHPEEEHALDGTPMPHDPETLLRCMPTFLQNRVVHRAPIKELRIIGEFEEEEEKEKFSRRLRKFESLEILFV